ncbi:transporter substrate-binding domain-containing protein [Butyrivibrio sp. AE2032]|uniref:transporter substrate-binding domain-containing protein n=1 Tax=Butyrivibrio sp. AE2032 TaxID=1458463 RepID=UPI0006915954|nr:transporter substrate-binding domain-containing protein [Butyrivibrio sp. AE2032]
MKTFKRIAAGILSAALLLGLTSCAGASQGSAKKGLKILETPYTVEDYAMAINKDNDGLKNAIDQALKELTDDGTIPAIIQKYIPVEGAQAQSGKGSASESTYPEFTTIESGKLIMATNAFFPPYEYYEGDQVVGIDPEIAKAVADKLGLELVIEDVEFDSIIAGVQAGKYDIGCAGMTVTEDRLKSVNFSTPYATGIQSIIVMEDSEITDLDKLLDGSYKVGVQSGTTGDIYMTDDVGEDRIERFAKGNDAVIALQSGKIDAVVIDNEPAKAFVAAANK